MSLSRIFENLLIDSIYDFFVLDKIRFNFSLLKIKRGKIANKKFLAHIYLFKL